MELQRTRRSSGTAKAGLATGIVGTALGTLGILGSGANMLGGNRTVVEEVPVGPWGNAWGTGWNGGWGFGPGFGFGGYGYGFGTPQTVVVNSNDESGRTRNGRYYDHEGGCSEDHVVNRYELGLQQQLAEKDSQIALRDANTYNDQKMLEMYKYVDGQFKDIRNELCRQAVVNQKTEDSFALVKQDIDCCCRRMETAIANERSERKCADNSIITYVNGTFYPKQVADVTTGTATTPQTLYNPLPCDGQCRCNNNM